MNVLVGVFGIRTTYKCDSSVSSCNRCDTPSLFHVLFCLAVLSFLSSCTFHFVVNGAVAPVVVVELLLLLRLLFVVFGFIYIVSFRLHYYRVFANFHPFKSFCTNCVCVCGYLLSLVQFKSSTFLIYFLYFPEANQTKRT